ncbi:MAG: SDR family NAD(P)-dependent oxidoreductase [Bacteroidota bacterium]
MTTKRMALVTEAGNGLGKTFASILQGQGFEVLLAASEKSFRTLENTDLHEIQLVQIDVTKPQHIDKLRSYIVKRFGKLDVLVNNAEMANGFGQKITELQMEEVKELFNLNFFAAVSMIQKLYPVLLKSDNASIVNISSALGSITKMQDETFSYANYRLTAYSSAKAALEMLTLVLAREFATDPIVISSFDPIRLKNCTHNSTTICKKVENEFLDLVKREIATI